MEFDLTPVHHKTETSEQPDKDIADKICKKHHQPPSPIPLGREWQWHQNLEEKE